MKIGDKIYKLRKENNLSQEELANKLNLIPVGKKTVTGIDSKEIVDTYLIDIGLPNRMLLSGVEVAESAFVGGDILIGMNIIQMGDFAIANAKGKTRFSFCIPPHDNPICLFEKTQKVDKNFTSQPAFT